MFHTTTTITITTSIIEQQLGRVAKTPVRRRVGRLTQGNIVRFSSMDGDWHTFPPPPPPSQHVRDPQMAFRRVRVEPRKGERLGLNHGQTDGTRNPVLREVFGARSATHAQQPSG